MELVEKLENLIKLFWPDYSYTGWPALVVVLGLLGTLYNKINEFLKARKLQRISKAM